MTREEYESLLQSDYWKGYSYSLIKERNFTCEDCGRSFPNQRNMLNVHHLVYRETNPWSYMPEEVVVLCRECHQKRHGIYKHTTVESPVGPPVSQPNYPNLEMERERTERKIENKRQFIEERPNIKKGWIKYAIFTYLFLLLLYWTFSGSDERKVSIPIETSSSQNSVEEIEKLGGVEDWDVVDVQKNDVAQEQHNITSVKVEKKKVTENIKNRNEEVINLKAVGSISHSSQSAFSKETKGVESSAKSTLELLEEQNHASVVKQAERKGVSTEGTTIEILERMNHADVVKQAERKGVSTEGTTIEILERMNHADVVKQAECKGVSTEGTTIEILERMNHADVVKQAKRKGVSTEGTTIEILERMNHADVVKQAERKGVSTEGTTIEILERITRKELEKIR